MIKSAVRKRVGSPNPISPVQDGLIDDGRLLIDGLWVIEDT
jgi:hypothetical protein